MALPQFFIEELTYTNDDSAFCRLAESEMHHLKVKRVAPGETVIVVGRSGTPYELKVASIEDDGISGVVLRELHGTDFPMVTLFQGVSKGNRMDAVFRAGTELGVHTFVPVVTARSIVRFPDESKASAKGERWRKIAYSASEQSGRATVPTVFDPVAFSEALQIAKSCDVVVCPYEEAEYGSMREALAGVKAQANVGVFIGPEGGFEPSEIHELSHKLDARIVTLGQTVLRTETAGIVASALALYELGALGNTR